MEGASFHYFVQQHYQQKQRLANLSFLHKKYYYKVNILTLRD